MSSTKKKCTSKEHEKIDANSFCQECNIYTCKKCENIHSILFQAHHTYNINEDINQIFTGICKEESHSDKLKYFCKTHNVLCCAACITKIKDNENGQHSDCNICSIKDVEKEKKSKLTENLKILENLSLTLQDSIKEIKNIFEKINSTKEELKMEVQKIFTKLRNQINEREDEILMKVEKKFEKLFFKEDMVKECDKLPNKVKISLDKGKIIKNKWNNDKDEMNSLINDCINIENNIKYINSLNENMRRSKSINLNVKFSPEEKDINKFMGEIKNFGNIIFNNFKFKKCPGKIQEKRKYIVSGEEENILTKTGTDREWMGTICVNQLDKSKECIWKIKVRETQNYEIMIGVAPLDFDINSSLYNKCGWYYYIKNNTLYSGPPYNYRNKYYSTKIEKIFSDEEDNESIKKDISREKSENDLNSDDYKKDDYKKEDLKSIDSEKDSDSEKKVKKRKDSSDEDSDMIFEKKSVKKESSKSNSEEDNQLIEKEDKVENDGQVLTKIKAEITVILNFEKRSLKFMKDNELKGEYTDIVINKPLFPAIFLYNKNDTIEIEGFY